jgi:hypothetical protein
MHTDVSELPEEPLALYKKPKRTSMYQLTVSGGYLGGMFAIYTSK